MALVGCFTPRTPVPLPNLKFYRPKIVTISCAKTQRPPLSDGKGGKIHGTRTTSSRNLGEEKLVKSNPAKKEDKGSKEAEINVTP
ncbi:hypothetical protein O6P43_029214 [Quillaja saponaria]|uniref:Uncharacterized protein n=1 Tax=Quillaja saponaria TaxID=32244 RepID=A0AAD7L0W7_QUISA|nr:hypothetical protein O6P43_029214 [Quillaja saponaria]